MRSMTKSMTKIYASATWTNHADKKVIMIKGIVILAFLEGENNRKNSIKKAIKLTTKGLLPQFHRLERIVSLAVTTEV